MPSLGHVTGVARDRRGTSLDESSRHLSPDALMMLFFALPMLSQFSPLQSSRVVLHSGCKLRVRPYITDANGSTLRSFNNVRQQQCTPTTMYATNNVRQKQCRPRTVYASNNVRREQCPAKTLYADNNIRQEQYNRMSGDITEFPAVPSG